MKRIEGSPQPLGATIINDRINFAVSVPEGKVCELLLYHSGKKNPSYVYEMPEEDGIGEVRFLAVEGFDPVKYEYNFRIEGEVCVDPYAKELSRTKKFGENPDPGQHQIRCRVPFTSYDWEGDRILKIPLHEVVAYSLHVRGFTKHVSSGVSNRGTFAGVIEKIPYLKELGINQIQCMPVYEFDEVCGGKVNYWGYGQGHYFAPKASYSVTGHAVTKLKDMVKACHKAGIEVILEMPFTPDFLAQEAIACLKYYMLEFHVDGFVVNPYNVPWESLNNDPLLKGVKILRKDDRFQNIMRRFLKGDEGMVGDVIWSLRHNSRMDGECNYITAQTGFTLSDLVSYDAKHNEANGEHNQDGPDYNFSWNCGAEGPSRKRSVISLRKKQVKNAFALLMTAQGTPCILAGDEFENTQRGNNNVYCQDNETAWLNWNKLKKNDELFCYVKSLIAFRREHPILHEKEELLGLDRTSCGTPDVSYHGQDAWQAPMAVSSRELGVLYCKHDEQQDRCFIAYNMHWLKHSFALPNLPQGLEWVKVLDTSEEAGLADQKEKGQVCRKQIELKERSIVILVAKKEEKKAQNRQKGRRKA